jgi:pyruvate dehydrogenase E2 component (dihydrolipoamide acetyltransferase)
MPIHILMPALSPTMEDGKLAKWLVKEGEKVTAGKIIAEIETDKATMEVEAVDDGIMGRIMVAEGTEKVRVNVPIAILLQEGETMAALANMSAAPVTAAKTPASTVAPAKASPPSVAPSRPATPSPAPAAPVAAATNGHAVPAPVAGATGIRIAASPLARRLARDAGLDIAALQGSGPQGRIVKADVEKAKASGGARAAAKPAMGQAVATTGGQAVAAFVTPMADDKVLALYDKSTYELVPHDGMRRIVAQRMVQSKSTVPHFYLRMECRLDNLLSARERMNAASPKSGPRAFKLSVNDFVIKAWALALQQVPAANASWTEGGMLRHKYSDVGVAVAVEGGLFTPVIRHAEMKSLSEISNEMKDLAERARKRRLAPHEYQGGTTAISNLGMFGVTSFEAILNPPQATIVAIGSGEKKVIPVGDKMEIATIMTATLSCDHRAVDGALGAELLAAFRMLIEDPVRMLV